MTTHERPLLEVSDVDQPLSPSELVDASAILFDAGLEAEPHEMTAFAYYHRKRLDALVQHPGIYSDTMLHQLFGRLPQEIAQDGLIDRLTAEVERLHEQHKIEKPVALMEDAEPTFTTQQVKLAATQPAAQVSGKLFETEPAALDAEPSPALFRKAGNLEKYYNNTGQLIAPTVKLYDGLKPGWQKKAFYPVVALNLFIGFIPVAILDATYGNFIRGRFKKQMIKEYPHLKQERWAIAWKETSLKGGTLSYVTPILALREVQKTIDPKDDGPSSGTKSFFKDRSQPTMPSSPKRNLNPILADI